MRYKINMILLTILSVSSFQIFANIFDEQPPNGVSKAQWLSLEQATLEQKLLPTPNGLGGQNTQLGRSFSIDNDRMLVGTGVNAIIFEFDGNSWVETQKLMDKPELSYSWSFADSVILSGNHAVVNDPLAYLYHTGAVHAFEFDGNNWNQLAKLTASDGVDDDQFGYSVSISGDRMVIGAPSANADGAYAAGVVYVFEFNGNNWIETAKLTPFNSLKLAHFGRSVAIDGERILVAAPGGSAGSYTPGLVYSFVLNGDSWEQEDILVAPDAITDGEFGWSISLEGNRVLIGAPGNNGISYHSGAAYLFEYNGDDWVQKAKLIDNDGVDYASFGNSVKLQGDQILINTEAASYVHLFEQSGDQWIQAATLSSNEYYFGETLAIYNDQLFISSWTHNHNGVSTTGAVHVYKELGMDWIKSEDVVASDSAARDAFGYAVSLSGNRALVGAYGDNYNGENLSGSAYFFEYIDGSWTDVGKFTGNGGSFGQSVNLSGDWALVGAPNENTDTDDSGAAYVYYFNGIQWNQVGKLVADEPIEDSDFGIAVDIENSIATVGASKEEAVYVFEFNDNLLQFEQTAKLVKPEGNEKIKFGHKISLSGDRILIGGDTFHYEDCMILCPPSEPIEGFAYIFEYDGNSWVEMAKLIASDSYEGNYFGNAVSLHDDRAIIGAPSDDTLEHDAGAVYVFDFDGVSWTESSKLTAPDIVTSERFGFSVSLDGDQLLVGTQHYSFSEMGQNKAYAFKKIDNAWTVTNEITSTYGQNQDNINFATAVSLSGSRGLIGAPSDDGNGDNSGSAYIFNFDLIYRNSFESSVD